MLLKNKKALVTGSSRGIGRKIVEVFLANGCEVWGMCTKESAGKAELEKFAAENGTAFHEFYADAGNAEVLTTAVKNALGESGGFDVLVNNAGTISLEVTVEEMEEAEWDRVVNTDLKGVYLNCKYFIPLIKARKGNHVGKIINISSELSKKGRVAYGAYAASKGGINSLTMCLALELAPEINVNIVAPGPVETDMILADMPPEWVEKEKEIPL